MGNGMKGLDEADWLVFAFGQFGTSCEAAL